jgi:hypothetical protein
MNLTRRQLMAGFASTITLTTSAARATPPSDADRFVRMRTAHDGKPVMWVYGGVLLAKPEGQVARPLVGVGGVSFTRAVQSSPGVYDWQLDEVGYYRDLETGAVLDHYVNPLNGKEVRPANYRAPLHLTYSASEVRARDKLPEGTEFTGRITRLAEVAGLAAMTEDLYVRTPSQAATDSRPARAARYLASLGTFTARAAELDNAGSRWIDCQLNYSTMNSFAPWLDMEGVPGVQNLRLAGRKCRLFEANAIPEWFRVRAMKDHPQFFDEPRSWR